MNQTFELGDTLPTGKGKLILDGSDTSAGQFFGDVLGFDIRSSELNIVLQTPSEENTGHPFWDSESYAMRATNDLRSFYIPTSIGASSITVKGGDMPYMGRLLRQRGFAPIKRVKSAQIPGSCLATDAKNEFNAAMDLHDRLIEVFGELAPTAFPLTLHEITHVRNAEGQLQDIISYANSNEYAGPMDGKRRREFGLLEGESIGDALFSRLGVRPAVYKYGLPEPNIRVNDLYSYRLFGFYDDASKGYDVAGYQLQDSDPLLHMNTDVDRMGDNLTRSIGRKNRVIGLTYKLLAQVYGFNPGDVLPDNVIDDKNYHESLNKIGEKCQKNSIDTLVLEQFIANTTRMAALAHSVGKVFSRGEVVGGSFMPRNVTLRGSVLDLDTFGKLNPAAFNERFKRDIVEMTLSIASIERVVRKDNSKNLFKYVLDSYHNNLTLAGATNKRANEMIESLTTDSAVAGAAACLQAHKLEI